MRTQVLLAPSVVICSWNLCFIETHNTISSFGQNNYVLWRICNKKWFKIFFVARSFPLRFFPLKLFLLFFSRLSISIQILCPQTLHRSVFSATVPFADSVSLTFFNTSYKLNRTKPNRTKLKPYLTISNLGEPNLA